MKQKNGASKVLSTMIRYTVIQIGSWATCKYALESHPEGILWMIGTYVIAIVTLAWLIPYFSAKTVQRTTLLGYESSRNGVMFVHIGIGSFLILTLLNIWHFVIPTLVLLFGAFVIFKRLRRQSTSRNTGAS